VSRPDDTAEQPVTAPTVRTAPSLSRAQRWWSAVPSHVGPARTSTVVLAVLFLTIGALYLTVRPDPTPSVTTGGTVQTTTTTAPRTTAPTTQVPTTTAPESTTGTVPTTTETTTTTEPTATTTEEPVPESTPATSFPTTTVPTSPPTTPTTASPPG
jgi:hypothetical protein